MVILYPSSAVIWKQLRVLMHKKLGLEENISLGLERLPLIIIFTQDMYMVFGDTPERPVIDSIIKIR